MFSAMTFEANVLTLIDQRLLPAEEVWLRCETLESVAIAIETMAVRGAPAIGCAAAFAIVLDANEACGSDLKLGQYQSRFEQICARLERTRPTAVNLFYAIGEMKKVNVAAAREMPLSNFRDALCARAQELYIDDIATCRAIGEHGADAIVTGCVEASRRKLRLLTHCNTGSLATAGYGTALGVIRSLHARDLIDCVFVDETRPWLQGARLTAFELAKDGIPYQLIADSTAAYLMQQGMVDAVVTGADRIAANGDTANKIGTYSLAVNCHHHHIAFYIAAPIATFDFNIKTGSEIPVEQREATELTHQGSKQIAPSGAVCYNPSFDVTPHVLISGIISEKGVARPPYGETLSKLKLF